MFFFIKSFNIATSTSNLSFSFLDLMKYMKISSKLLILNLARREEEEIPSTYECKKVSLTIIWLTSCLIVTFLVIKSSIENPSIFLLIIFTFSYKMTSITTCITLRTIRTRFLTFINNGNKFFSFTIPDTP